MPYEDLLAQVPLFAGLPTDALGVIGGAARPVRFRAGEWLFRSGDDARSLSVVHWGRVEVILETGSRMLGPGALVGELAFLTSSGRSADARAVRDSELLEIGYDDFRRLLNSHPALGLELARMLAVRLQRFEDEVLATPDSTLFAIVPLEHGLDLSGLCDELCAALRVFGRTAIATPRTDAGSFGAVLDRLERDNDRVVLLASPDVADPWTEFCLRQADRVLSVAGAHGVPSRALAGAVRNSELALSVTRPDAGLLVDAIDANGVHRVDSRTGIERTARRLLGKSLGIVLSGGGARALAHIGVLAELNHAGLVIDRVGGCSMGAFVAGMFAMGWHADRMRDVAFDELVRHRPFGDYTVPRHALIKAHRAAAMLARVFGDARWEQLERPGFAVSADLVSGDLIVHRSGPVFESVGMSMSLPGLVPPVARDGRLLVDGGVLDNLPVDVMASSHEGPIVAVDVLRKPPPESTAGSLPSIVDTLARATVLGSVQRAEQNRRLAAVVICPEAGDVGLLDFRRIDDAIDAGRRAAIAALESGALESGALDAGASPTR